MICLHDWELGMFRFLPGQVFFFWSQVSKCDSPREGGLNFSLKLQWLDTSFLFPPFFAIQLFFSLSPHTMLQVMHHMREGDYKWGSYKYIYICKATRKSINNFFLGLCTSVTCIVFETVFLESKSVQWVPVFFRFAEPNSVEYTPVRWSRDSTQSRGGRNITHNTVGTNFNLSWSVNLTPH